MLSHPVAAAPPPSAPAVRAHSVAEGEVGARGSQRGRGVHRRRQGRGGSFAAPKDVEPDPYIRGGVGPGRVAAAARSGGTTCYRSEAHLARPPGAEGSWAQPAGRREAEEEDDPPLAPRGSGPALRALRGLPSPLSPLPDLPAPALPGTPRPILAAWIVVTGSLPGTGVEPRPRRTRRRVGPFRPHDRGRGASPESSCLRPVSTPPKPGPTLTVPRPRSGREGP